MRDYYWYNIMWFSVIIIAISIIALAIFLQDAKIQNYCDKINLNSNGRDNAGTFCYDNAFSKERGNYVANKTYYKEEEIE